MSSDRWQVGMLRAFAPALPRGMVAQGRRRSSKRDGGGGNRGLAYLRRAAAARPQFIAYAVDDLPAAAPLLLRYVARLPLFAWTVRNEKIRSLALRLAGAIIIE